LKRGPFGVAPRSPHQPIAVRRVVRDDCNPARHEAFEDLGLCICDRLFRAKIFDVRRRYGRDESDVRLHLRG
jgi:hypothetical protein